MKAQELMRKGTAPVAALRMAIAALIVVACAAVSVRRNEAWRSLLALWTDCARKSPEKSRTRNNLGNCNLLLKSYFPAIEEYRKAVELDPGNMEAQYNLATTLDAVGLLSEAIKPYAVFCRQVGPRYASQRGQACRRLQELLAAAGGRREQ